MHGVPSNEGAEHQDVGAFFIAGPLARGLKEHESVIEDVSCLPVGFRLESVEE